VRRGTRGRRKRLRVLDSGTQLLGGVGVQRVERAKRGVQHAVHKRAALAFCGIAQGRQGMAECQPIRGLLIPLGPVGAVGRRAPILRGIRRNGPVGEIHQERVRLVDIGFQVRPAFLHGLLQVLRALLEVEGGERVQLLAERYGFGMHVIPNRIGRQLIGSVLVCWVGGSLHRVLIRLVHVINRARQVTLGVEQPMCPRGHRALERGGRLCKLLIHRVLVRGEMLRKAHLEVERSEVAEGDVLGRVRVSAGA